LTTLIHSYHKSIGAMLVALNGCDALVFTGTVGERSSIIRKRIVAHLQFCDFILDGEANDACTQPQTMTLISQETASKPLFVIPTSEARQIAEHVIAFI
jgi:acetate kinase